MEKRIKKTLVPLVVSFLLGVSCSKELVRQPDTTEGSEVIVPEFVSREEAARLLQTDDAYTKHWGRFDLMLPTPGEEGSKEDRLRFAAGQARAWTTEEEVVIRRSVEHLNRTIREKGLQLRFPETVRLLKSTMEEEPGAAGYTRGTYIVITDRIMEHPEYADQLLAHELFHVLTRSNPEFRRKMYRLIDFHILPQEIEFPQALRDCMIANPDVTGYDNFSTFTIDGEPTDCCMIIFSDRPYEGGSLFDYIRVGLVAIDKDRCKAVERDGKPVVYPVDKAADFFDKIGRNTSYAIDPEEVLADNFSLILIGRTAGLPSPELIRRLEEACR